MGAYLASPGEETAHPGIIVLQEAFGVNSHIRNVADRLAGRGDVAIAPTWITAPHRDSKPATKTLPLCRMRGGDNGDGDR